MHLAGAESGEVIGLGGSGEHAEDVSADGMVECMEYMVVVEDAVDGENES